MRRRMKPVAVVFIALLALAQFIRPERANQAIDAARTIQAQVGATSELVAADGWR